jgi:hypothetical protein
MSTDRQQRRSSGGHRKRGKRGSRCDTNQPSEPEGPLSPQQQREWDRVQSMRQLARSGAPIELLWAIQQNQMRQHQIQFANQQRGPHQQQQVDALGRAIAEQEERIREQAQASGWLWLVERYCRTPYSYEATLLLQRELQVLQQEQLKRCGSSL